MLQFRDARSIATLDVQTSLLRGWTLR